MMLSATAAFLLLTAQDAPGAKPVNPDHPEIVVEGQREDERKGRIAEDPYPMVEREMLGSRIKRKTERGFRTVATNTGLAGVQTYGSSSGGVDATGGMTMNRRNRVIRECKSSFDKLSETTACELWLAEKAMSEGRLDDADKTIGKLMDMRHMSTVDRYHVAQYAYLLAEQQDDDGAKEKALDTLFATGMMADDEKLKALKTMARLKLKRQDQPGAIAALEQLLAATPDDASSQANLATLYAWEGQHDKALPRMQTAVSLVEQKGNTPPKSWTDYLRDHARN
jgi:tetratricopeptide (TPR) repeat protein